MNYIKQLNSAMSKIYDDKRLYSSHVSLYVSLFQYWNLARFSNPFQVFRDEIMNLSKIGPKSTYHKCMKELTMWGYIQYIPTHNPLIGSKVEMYVFDKELASPKMEQLNERSSTESVQQIGQSSTEVVQPIGQPVPISVQLNEPLIKNTNIKHTKQVNREKKFSTPTQEEVKKYFNSLFSSEKDKKIADVESQKFFNYYTSNGWKVGGKTPMKNWNAAARNWVLKSKENTNGKPQVQNRDNLHTNENKNYHEPL